MIICKTKDALKTELNKLRRDSPLAFIPTMGYLHDGHISLVTAGKQQSKRTIVSIFVNPTQFNDPNDYAKYPINIEMDIEMLKAAGADLLFIPNKTELYDTDAQTWVEVTELTRLHCGASRPGHFRGVTTIVTKLFNLVQPDIALFGEKDFQQLAVIRKMTEDLCSPIKIIGGPIVRESDGLAMSSRNARLSTDARSIAPVFYKSLQAAVSSYKNGETRATKLREIVLSTLSDAPQITVDYINFVDSNSLLPIDNVSKSSRLLGAIFLDGIRLIDNIGFAS